MQSELHPVAGAGIEQERTFANGSQDTTTSTTNNNPEHHDHISSLLPSYANNTSNNNNGNNSNINHLASGGGYGFAENYDEDDVPLSPFRGMSASSGTGTGNNFDTLNTHNNSAINVTSENMNSVLYGLGGGGGGCINNSASSGGVPGRARTVTTDTAQTASTLASTSTNTNMVSSSANAAAGTSPGPHKFWGSTSSLSLGTNIGTGILGRTTPSTPSHFEFNRARTLSSPGGVLGHAAGVGTTILPGASGVAISNGGGSRPASAVGFVTSSGSASLGGTPNINRTRTFLAEVGGLPALVLALLAVVVVVVPTRF